MANTNEKITVVNRLTSMLIDYLAASITLIILIILAFYKDLLEIFTIFHDPSSSEFGASFLLIGLGFSVYFNKDILNARSPGKRIFNLQVIDNETGFAANPLKCFVRNLTIFIWPIEIIMLFINSKRRIGDHITGTSIEYVTNPVKHQIELPKLVSVILITICISIIFYLPFYSFDSDFEIEVVPYISNTFDKKASEKANILFMNKFSETLKETDFRIYEKIEYDNRKYVAGILYFKNKSDYDNFEESERIISEFLISEFPLKKYICFLKYVYKENGSININSCYYKKRKQINFEQGPIIE